MKKQNKSFKRAFSLIELAIVVVVMAVLLVGITKVKSMISLSETRATQITENPYKPSIPEANLVAWFSASSRSNVEESNGKVIKWKDLSDAGNDAVVFNNGGADHDGPVYSASGVNGKPALYFNPGYLKFDASSIQTGNHTIFIVQNNDPYVDSAYGSGGNEAVVLSFFNSSLNNRIVFHKNPGGSPSAPRPYLSYNAFIGALMNVAGDLFPTSQVLQYYGSDTRLLSFIGVEGGSPDGTPYWDGHELINNAVNNDAWQGTLTTNYAVIGGNNGSSATPAANKAYMDGYISEIIIYQGDLGASDVKKVNDYLKDQYNIGDLVCEAGPGGAASDVHCHD